MVTIGFRIPQGALEACKKQIESKLATIVADVATKTYNSILRSSWPYYSGSYISSWNISVGSKDSSYNDPVWQRGVYLAPREVKTLSVPSAYTKVYISNSTPHAMQVEIDGTPTHDGGWYIAAHARNNTLGSYKFF